MSRQIAGIGTPTCVASEITGEANGKISGVTDLDATGTITADTFAAVTKVFAGTVEGSTGNFGTLKGFVGDITTLNTTGHTTLGDGLGSDILTVNATSTFNAPVTINGTLTTTGKAKLDSLEVTNNALVNGNLTVNGTTTLNGTLNMKGNDITGVGTLSAMTGSFTFVNAGEGNFNILAVSGDTVLGVSPGATLTVNASSVFNAPATVNSKLTTNTLEVTNDADVKGNLTVAGNAAVKGSLTVEKGVTVSESFTVTPGSTISMGGNVVHNVATPILDTDAANKGYVDAGLAKAFKDIDRNTQGIAIAMAMSGLALPADKNFALGANLGFFEDKQAVAVQAAIRVNPYLTVTGGVGAGVQDANTLGGRVGMQVAW